MNHIQFCAHTSAFSSPCSLVEVRSVLEVENMTVHLIRVLFRLFQLRTLCVLGIFVDALDRTVVSGIFSDGCLLVVSLLIHSPSTLRAVILPFSCVFRFFAAELFSILTMFLFFIFCDSFLYFLVYAVVMHHICFRPTVRLYQLHGDGRWWFSLDPISAFALKSLFFIFWINDSLSQGVYSFDVSTMFQVSLCIS